jgi:hypothetical protein
VRPATVAGDRSRLAAAALVAGNVVPLVGVVAFDWSLASLLVVYWVESGIVGAFSVAKIRRATGGDDPDDLPSLSFDDRSVASFVGEPNDAIARFFIGHYGGFWAIHGGFVVALSVTFLADAGPIDPVAVAVVAGSLVASHGYSYRVNFVGEREFERAGPVTLMVDPYRRVFVLHLTIVLGAFAVDLVGAPVGALVVMVLAKTALDLRAHRREHARMRARERERREGGPDPERAPTAQ